MIRRAEAKDVEGVNRLLSQVLEVHASGRPDIFISGTRKYTDEELIGIFQDEERPVFVYIDEEGQVLGHAFCVIQQKGSNNTHAFQSLYVDDVCVDENHRGRHIASALYEHVREYAREIGCYNITLSVWELNDGARKFYDSIGLKPLKTTMEEILKGCDN